VTRAGANARMRRPSGRSESEPPVQPAPGWSPGAPAKYEPRRSDAAPVPRPDVATGAGDARGLGVAIRAASPQGAAGSAIETRSPPRSSASIARCPPCACATEVAIGRPRPRSSPVRSEVSRVASSTGPPVGISRKCTYLVYAGLIRGLRRSRTMLAQDRRRTHRRTSRASPPSERPARLSPRPGLAVGSGIWRATSVRP
jgi:hypothetical protein